MSDALFARERRLEEENRRLSLRNAGLVSQLEGQKGRNALLKNELRRLEEENRRLSLKNADLYDESRDLYMQYLEQYRKTWEVGEELLAVQNDLINMKKEYAALIEEVRRQAPDVELQTPRWLM